MQLWPARSWGFSGIGRSAKYDGATTGGMPETQEMPDFRAGKGTVAEIGPSRADQINAACECTLGGDVKYRVVIDNATLATAA